MATIIGTELDDNLTGTTGADTISGLGGRDHLYGGAGNDTLLGGAGDDAMHGDAGADIMFGGSGNDDYYVDDVNDVCSETTVAGVDDGGTNDRVYSTVSYALSPFIERLVLLESAAAISATGSVMWDADGSGPAAGIALAKLQAGAAVTADNFAISGATSNPVVGNISINDVTITEGNSGTSIATFTVTRSGGTAAFAVNYGT